VGLYTLLGVMVMVVAPPGVVVTLVAVGVAALLVMVVAMPGAVEMPAAAVMPLFGSTVTLAVVVAVLAVTGAAVAGAAVPAAAFGAGVGVAALETLCPVP